MNILTLMIQLRKVLKQLANKTFADISKECGAPDDVTVGFLLWQSEVALTEIDQFHSHLENLSEISDFENQVRNFIQKTTKRLNKIFIVI